MKPVAKAGSRLPGSLKLAEGRPQNQSTKRLAEFASGSRFLGISDRTRLRCGGKTMDKRKTIGLCECGANLDPDPVISIQAVTGGGSFAGSHEYKPPLFRCPKCNPTVLSFAKSIV